jgi:hypothetical protein
MRGEWNEGIEGKSVAITGDITIAADLRNRTLNLHTGAGDDCWRELKRRWKSGEMDAEWLAEEWIYLVIEDALGEMSDPPEFVGGSYTVVLS